MRTETELKLRLRSSEDMQRVLAWCRENLDNSVQVSQRDEYYDTPTEDLRKQDLSLRLRTVNGRSFVALKSPRVFLTENIHDRIELEFEAADRDEVFANIERYGLAATAITEKRRWEFKKDDFKIVIDQLPFIGSFLEIEAPTVERITSIILMLGVSESDGVNKNYSELLEDKLKEIGLPVRPQLRATFDDETTWYSRRPLT